VQIDDYRRGLLKQMLGRDEQGDVVRRAGVMAVVLTGGAVRPGDLIGVREPVGERLPLQPV
jgi:MOSC domain-containing protein YiiM